MFKTKKAKTETAHCVINLTESNRDLLQKMNFPEIPAEAKAIAFFPDGNAIFLQDMIGGGPVFGHNIPQFVSMTYFTNVEIEIPD